MSRSCNFVGVWYPDDPSHVNALSLLSEKKYDFACILHDKDIDENGELLKPHWHVFIRFEYQKTQLAASKTLGISPNYIQVCRNMNSALRYLVHADDPDKFQYCAEEVFGPLSGCVQLDQVELTENERAVALIDLIDKSGEITVGQLLRRCAVLGLYGDARRLGSLLVRMVDDHNSGY